MIFIWELKFQCNKIYMSFLDCVFYVLFKKSFLIWGKRYCPIFLWYFYLFFSLSTFKSLIHLEFSVCCKTEIQFYFIFHTDKDGFNSIYWIFNPVPTASQSHYNLWMSWFLFKIEFSVFNPLSATLYYNSPYSSIINVLYLNLTF